MKIRGIFTILMMGLFLNFISFAQELPTEKSTLFSGSGNCSLCHKAGPPNETALLDTNGVDISPISLWRSTIMSHAAIDPIWQAKVTTEVTTNPIYKEFIEDKCVTCHTPMARTEAKFNGQEYYSLSEAQVDPIALDGVSCTLCHQITPDNLGDHGSWSGNYLIDNNKILYGPFENPFASPMTTITNYTPIYGEHIHSSDLCATCHTLFTPTLDDDANIVGEIPEQTPYLEWRNSIYPNDGIECQTCHMPEVEEKVLTSTMPPSISQRDNFSKHYFVGGNVYLLRLLKEHGVELGVKSSSEYFDSTIARTINLLQNKTAELNSDYNWISSTELEVKVALKNISGHKFPTGYPSRRAWLKLEVKDNNGSIIYSSGSWDPTSGEINELDQPYEPHYDVISSADQVQIYQAVMNDVDGKVTYTLLKGADYIKDNRIPPIGYKSTGPFADSTKNMGMVIEDPNFNINKNLEGSGIDSVTYIISNLNSTDSYSLSIQLLYQSLEPNFVKDLFQYDTPEVNKFKFYYNQSDNSPVVMKFIEMDIIATDVSEDNLKIPEEYILFNSYPNPFNPSTIIKYGIPSESQIKISIYNLLGEEIGVLYYGIQEAGFHNVEFNASDLSSGIYLYRVSATSVDTRREFQGAKKMVLLK